MAAAAATSQHRCVFVGNIPYDATEEQLIQICEEVGPVVSFRLVIDRETGKPKGYGFCEYKDEETALSARRNLQGYEINGRQLRVDFAENDKNADRNRDQGRGGPGMVTNVGPQKQLGGPAIVGDPGIHQPIGLQVAMAAASVMAGVLGGAQANRELNQNGLQGQPASYGDPLTLHLAKMSWNQLNEVMSELKVTATQNKEQARQLLLASPQLPKALFQAQIMLGMVTPQMLQMPNIRQASGPPPQPLSQDVQQGQQPVLPIHSGLPPFAHKMQFGLVPREQEAQMSSLPPNPLAHNQYSSLPQLSTHPRAQLPQLPQNQVVEQGAFPSVRPPPLSSASSRPQVPVAGSFYPKQQMQPPLLQHEGQAGANYMGHNSQLFAPNTTFQSSVLTRPLVSKQIFQSGASTSTGIPEKANMFDSPDPMSRPSKLMKLDVGRSTSAVGVNLSASLSGPSRDSGASLSKNQIPEAEEAPNSQKKAHQSQLPPDVESALLQQVLNLTPEQLSSLPPDQQQQVIQLQQMLR